MKLFQVVTTGNSGTKRFIPMAANNRDQAVNRVKMIVPDALFLVIRSVKSVESVAASNEDKGIRAIERLESDWCDYADGNDRITDNGFDEGIEFIKDTYDAFWAACDY